MSNLLKLYKLMMKNMCSKHKQKIKMKLKIA